MLEKVYQISSSRHKRQEIDNEGDEEDM